MQNVALKALFSVPFLVISTLNPVHAEGSLNIYNWSDYIAEETIANFSAETGIDVTYDVYDANEILEAKLLAGKSGYDIVFPTARPFAARHVKAGLYAPLDKTKLEGLENLDASIQKSLESIDAGNAHLVPYMWGTTGIGINVDKVKAILGDDTALDSWKLLFDPQIAAKLAACGLSVMDDPMEAFAAARTYAGLDATDYSKAAIVEAGEVITAMRPSVRYFHSSQYINDLANGDLCVAHGYSGDVLQARDRAKEAGNGVNIVYLVPQEGAVVWTDVMAIPADAPNMDEAMQFVNYMLKPEVIAPVTDFVSYANANTKANALIDETISQDPGVYPAQATRDKFVAFAEITDKQTRNITRTWTKVKTGR